MNILTTNGTKIAGVVACLPERLVGNREACAELYGEGVDTLIKATGIEARALANPGTTALDLEVRAAQELLAKTETKPEEIGVVICVTFTPEHLMPADAPSAQARLGIPNQCASFDINMACSGYAYGLSVGAMFAERLHKKVLLLNGDVQSIFTSQEDKATMPVLADIGTATLLVPDDAAESWQFSFYSLGEKREVLYIPAGGSSRPASLEDLQYVERDDGSRRREADIYMDGFEVFRFVAKDTTRFLKGFMEECEVGPEVLDAFVPHQANVYMISQLSKKLGIPRDKMWVSGDRYGNPASASVPLTIAENGCEWFAAGNGGKTLISGFGGGLSISAGFIELPSDSIYETVRYEE